MIFKKENKISTLKALKESYDKLFAKSPIKESDYYYNLTFKILSPEKGKKLLDVACGGGYFLKKAEEAGVQCYGLDISEEALKIAKKITSYSKLVCADGESIPFKDEFFDYVTNLGSLEHFLNPEKGLKEMKRVLKENGKALILLPNSYFLMIILNVMRTGSIGVRTEQEIERLATRKEWEGLIVNSGFKIEKIFKYNYKSSEASVKYKIVRPFIPFNLSYAFIFVCRR
jgi:SAM-dependent methyltransferase